ncbi:MAG TPA: alkaline phosphatase family protein [Nitrososphaeraceae archaeon]|nr:alkaline phosphatase family protein [Nitrososphaeraceae archaeon]
MIKHVIVIDVVGIEEKHIQSGLLPTISRLAENGESCKMKPVFPAVTCPVQTSLLTGEYPNRHGIISNGFMDRSNYNVSFWEQYSNLVQVPRIWDMIKNTTNDFKTAVLFWQNTLYANSDIIITPKPIHLENEMKMWCYSKPVGYYETIKEQIGEFDLSSYWGPFASKLSSEWITKASQFTIENHKPNFMFTYIPHVDYSAQRFGKDSNEVYKDLVFADSLVENIIDSTKKSNIYEDTQFILFSEYSFNDVDGSVPINNILRNNGLLKVRNIGDKEYIDFEFSQAFAVVDHQIANIYVKSPNDIKKIVNLFSNIKGIDMILTDKEKQVFKIDHERSGDIILIANREKWFNYYWWYDDNLAPSFTKTVDIHRKPGFDPLELFIDYQKKSIPFNTNLIKGSHGRPVNTSTDEGYSLYVSNIKSNLEKDELNSVDVIQIGKYLINMH